MLRSRRIVCQDGQILTLHSRGLCVHTIDHVSRHSTLCAIALSVLFIFSPTHEKPSFFTAAAADRSLLLHFQSKSRHSQERNGGRTDELGVNLYYAAATREYKRRLELYLVRTLLSAAALRTHP